jgi:hypothetical protein
VTDEFSFVDRDRTFTCRAEARSAASPSERWWWFHVSSEMHNRYAPFRAASGDTKRSVQSRIVAYYDELLARRAAPATSYYRRGAPASTATAATATPSVVSAAAPAGAEVAAKA